MWGCRTHWFQLPKRLRDAIWRTYSPGQEIRMNPSRDYIAVADEVQRWIRGEEPVVIEDSAHGKTEEVVSSVQEAAPAGGPALRSLPPLPTSALPSALIRARLAPTLARGKNDWKSPPEFLKVVHEFDSIGLDPCGGEDDVVAAQTNFRGGSAIDDGLKIPWNGRGLVYCNPPYSALDKEGNPIPLYDNEIVQGVARWVEKARREATERLVEIIMLTAARPDTIWMQDSGAARVCFWRGRLKFVGASMSAPFPSAVLYWGVRTKRFEDVFGPHGKVTRW
jgi:hypothetical protein